MNEKSQSPIQNSWQTHFDHWLKPYWETATPGMCFQVHQQGQLIFDYRGGQYYPYYDLASVTKVLFTVPAMMLSLHRGMWHPESRLNEIIQWWPHSQTKIVDLLTHSSGLVWWKAFYQELMTVSQKEMRWDLLKKEITELPIINSTKSVYSDVGFLTLAFLLEEMWNAPLIEIWNKVKTEFANNSTLHWLPLVKPQISIIDNVSRAGILKIEARIERTENTTTVLGGEFFLSNYAPTELCPWRGRRIQAEVHDENAWALGGISTHSGLFGNCSDVASVFLTFRKAFFQSQHPLHSTVRFFMKRQIPPEKGDWGLGFVLPTRGGSTSGQFFSDTSVGHTGFTGTSVWWDPEKDIMITILSNRLFYAREKREFAKLRPLLHDEIISLLRSTERT